MFYEHVPASFYQKQLFGTNTRLSSKKETNSKHELEVGGGNSYKEQPN